MTAELDHAALAVFIFFFGLVAVVGSKRPRKQLAAAASSVVDRLGKWGKPKHNRHDGRHRSCRTGIG
jgi:hypothetical protein